MTETSHFDNNLYRVFGAFVYAFVHCAVYSTYLYYPLTRLSPTFRSFSFFLFSTGMVLILSSAFTWYSFEQKKIIAAAEKAAVEAEELCCPADCDICGM